MNMFPSPPRRSLAPIVFFLWATLGGWPLMIGLAKAAPLSGPISVLPADGVIEKPANYFDLEGRMLRFTPASNNGYSLAVLPAGEAAPRGTRLSIGNALGQYNNYGWSVPLGF